ncbi:MAG TPA: hypothetical protein PK667_10775, partial [Nitrosomonas europaea]|uniref:hypothetical protein n=1 Tax=Nitrosomonas europaea TaxID=915 RepID=UPI002BEEE866
VMSCHVMSCHVMSCKNYRHTLDALQTFFEFFMGFSTNFSVLFHKNEKNDVGFQRRMNRKEGM